MDAQTTNTQAVKAENPLARVTRVAGAVNLEHIRFVQFNCSALAERTSLIATDTAYKVGFTRPKVQRVNQGFSVSSTLVFTLDNRLPSSDGGEAREPLAALRATVELSYSQKPDSESLSDEDVAEFANVNVPFNSWGYWREFVQSSLARLGVAQTVVLPLFRLQTAKTWMIDDESSPSLEQSRGHGETADAAASKSAVQ